jgi:periplasmic mercuric ion binding protein
MKNILVFLFIIGAGHWATAQQTVPSSCTAEKKACCTKEGTAVSTTCSEAKTATVTTGMVKKKAATSAFQTAQFQVWGNCGMCKKTIETAAMAIEGVSAATWNTETHQFNFTFDATKTSVDKVHQAIATAGYDTDAVKANDQAYSNLHACCQYERKKG